jgi:Fe-S-cluster containining protein
MSLDEHQRDEDGEHWPDECELCLEESESCVCACKCGNCCEQLILEASHRDAEREPRIKAKCQPFRDFEDVVGYYLNDPANEHACHFFNREARLCTIYETRPLMCRLFNCDEPHNDDMDAALGKSWPV